MIWSQRAKSHKHIEQFHRGIYKKGFIFSFKQMVLKLSLAVLLLFEVPSSQWRHMGLMASYITSNLIVCTTACSGWQQRKHIRRDCIKSKWLKLTYGKHRPELESTTHTTFQTAQTIGSTSIWHRSDLVMSDQCLIDINPMVFAVWDFESSWQAMMCLLWVFVRQFTVLQGHSTL